MAGPVAAQARPARSASAGGVRRPKRRVGIHIDMTPMVDVAFLLLIFFMVTTVFRRPLAMEVNMPEPGARVEVPESNVLTVYVDADETMFQRMGTGGLAPLGWDDLGRTFRDGVAAKPDLIVLVRIHPEARYERMVDMMDTLDDAGMHRFSVVKLEGEDLELLKEAR